MTDHYDPDGRSYYRLEQERECYRYIPSHHPTSHFAPLGLANYGDFTPKSCQDPTLTSFAQLGAIRLGAQRALISLFDRTHEYIIAEATQTLSLQSDLPQADLRLGSCALPKKSGVGHHVERLSSSGSPENITAVEGNVLIISDVTEDTRFKSSKLCHALSDVRFFASVPLISPRGFTIGAFSIVDNTTRRSGLEEHSLVFMNDMATIIMRYLAMLDGAHGNHSAGRMIAGLGSFVEGRSSLPESWRDTNIQHVASGQSGALTEGRLNIPQQHIQESARRIEHKALSLQDSQIENSDYFAKPTKNEHAQGGSPQVGAPVQILNVGDDLAEDPLPKKTEIIFSRAANLIRESIGVEGVMFLDVDGIHFGSLVDSHPGAEGSSSDNSTAAEFSSNRNSGEPDSASLCTCLGFSTSRASSINDDSASDQHFSIQENLMKALLRRYPEGKIFSCLADRLLPNFSDGTGESSINEYDHGSTFKGSNQYQEPPSSAKLRKSILEQAADHLTEMFPAARNILIKPLWDLEKGRCTTGVLVWSNDPRRSFTNENELVFIDAFNNSVLAQSRRLNVEIADRAETNLISNITHELRTPLHGILGTADILGDTAMNAMQYGMVHTIESCSRTLLDIINSLLELNFIDKYEKKASHLSWSRGNKQADLHQYSTTEGRSQSNDHRKAPSPSDVKLDEVLEEVIESVFAGYSFYSTPNAPPRASAGPSSQLAGLESESDQPLLDASPITIIFDIQAGIKWNFSTHAGAWRRILMNIFGNALKYMSSGFIHLELKSSQCCPARLANGPLDDHIDECDVTLTVKDTGQGIDNTFMQTNLFTPFVQENPIAPGSGLGLSIVRKAIRSLGGSIEVNSMKGVGTEFQVRVPLLRSDGRTSDSSKSILDTLQIQTKGKTVGLLGFSSSSYSERDRTLCSALERLCREWFGLKVSSVFALNSDNASFDFYIAVQTELDSAGVSDLFTDCQAFIGANGSDSPIVVICQSPGEAHNSFVAAQNRGDASNFEFISQPCGPRKLARALDLCLKRRLYRESGHTPPGASRWVEMPESSRLPLNIDISDSPEERMKISKRPSTDSDDSAEYSTSVHSGEPNMTPTLPVTSQLLSLQNDAPENTDHPNPLILLVDDNDLNLKLLCAYSRKGNFQYITARNGAEAVAAYAAFPSQIRGVILDISMPIMDGFEAARQIRRLENEHQATLSDPARRLVPPTLIAALTGLHSTVAQEEAFRSGIDTFLVKPVQRLEFYAVLQQAIDNR